VNDYEGLNLPQLMALLHDIVVPDPIRFTPQTPGWFTLAGWVLAVVLLLIRFVLVRRRHNAYRRRADALLTALEARADLDPAGLAVEVSVLLKQTALAAYPRATVATLYGSAWADFLRRSSRDDRVVCEAAERLALMPYRPDADGRDLVAPARRWIRVHRA
jgi:hypothetical protein